jgi:outer membrane immunogenic protein
MKKLLVSSIAALGLIGTPALAADMAVKAPPPAPVPVYSWTGFYIGGNVGYEHTKSDFTTIFGAGNGGFSAASVAFISAVGTGSASRDGFTGGGQAGYNWQSGNYLLGIEASINALSNSATLNFTGVTPGGTAFALSNSLHPKWIVTVNPRVGIVFDRVLFYATGGLAFLHATYNQTFADFSIGGGVSATSSTTKTGWDAGGGVEYALNRNWSVKAEYLYSQFAAFNTNTISVLGGGSVVNPVSGSANVSVQMARVGLNYQFH